MCVLFYYTPISSAARGVPYLLTPSPVPHRCTRLIECADNSVLTVTIKLHQDELRRTSPPASTSMNTPGNPSRSISWLFFNPANAKSTVQGTTIPGHALDTPIQNLEWVADLKRWFKFRTDKADIGFWRVGR